MMRCIIALTAALTAAFTFDGCRIRTVDPEEYLQPAAGHLNQAEARQLINSQLRKHGVKVAYNVKLNFKGYKFTADGFDYNLQVGYVYVITPTGKVAEGVEVPRFPSDSEKKILADMEKNERTFIAFIKEGTEAEIAADINVLVDKLYKSGTVFKQLEEKPVPDGGTGPDASTQQEDAGTPPPKQAVPEEAKKQPKSKVMQLIEDDEKEPENK
jgi:hypothetical protein